MLWKKMQPSRYNCTTYISMHTIWHLFVYGWINVVEWMLFVEMINIFIFVIILRFYFFSNRIGTGANPKKNLHSLRNPPPPTKKKNLFIHKVDKNIILNRYHGHYKFKRLTQTSVNNNELKFFFLQKAKKMYNAP